ncbi:MAG: cell division protein ZipA C-terminal FtsZ-binding domain-containing protein [Pseudomonadota bacterium]|nr:MAG: cell division protein ZipA C-terminal FtsZ-binding domain-containing protein [Pseudomonadota bacterium]
MDGLRVSLLLIGAGIVFGVYLLSKRENARGVQHVVARLRSGMKRLRERAAPRRGMVEAVPPVEHGENVETDFAPLNDVVAERNAGEISSAAVGDMRAIGELETDVPGGEQLVITFYIMAPKGRSFDGAAIRAATESTGMVHGDMNIFHLYESGKEAQRAGGSAVCSLANALEPGVFEPEAMTELSTPALVLFMVLPGPVEGREAFATTLDTGQALAAFLQGELCDESRGVLTPQLISPLRERVEAFRLNIKMAQVKRRHS